MAQIQTEVPLFFPQAMSLVERSSTRIADRWAPDSTAALRSPALRSLTFVDRMLATHRPMMDGRAVSRALANAADPSGAAWWLFPVPWYLDQRAGAVMQRKSPMALPDVAMPRLQPPVQ